MAGEKKTNQIKRRLKTTADIRRFLADLINRVNQEELDSQTAGKMGYLCQILSKVIEGSELEQRLDMLEKQIKEMR